MPNHCTLLSRRHILKLSILLLLAALQLGSAYAKKPLIANLKGKTAPAFTLPDLQNTSQASTQFKGKVVLLNFWATWCAPCREEIPLLIKYQERYAAQGFTVIGIAIDEPAEVAPYAQKMRINYPVWVSEAQAAEVSRQYGNTTGVLPYSVLIGRNGKIIRQIPGILKPDELPPDISQALKKK